MSFLSGGDEVLLDRVRKDFGASPDANGLEEHWFGPASQKLRDIARNRMTDAIRRLTGRAENWDGYGSAGANADSIFEAIAYIESFIEESSRVGANWADPHVGLSEEGHVVFEWWSGQRKLTVYIIPGAAPEYVSSWGSNIEEQMHVGALDEDQFAKQWRWLWTVMS